jgi:DNA-binding transcriptional regulator LsrR (DeoR family)
VIKTIRPHVAGDKREHFQNSEPMTGLGFDPVVISVWLYYRDQMTQGGIAELLGVSRASVINYLDEGRRRGLVQITVDEAALRQVSFAKEMVEQYGLADCIVIPDDGGAAHPSVRIGHAGALLLAREIRPKDRLGVASGRSVLALSTAMPIMSLSEVQVVQVTGSMTARNAFSPELCTSNIAQRIGGDTFSLHAPIFVSSRNVRDILMNEPALIEQFERIHSCTCVVFGIGALDCAGTVALSGLFTAEEINAYVGNGAVGMILGNFVDDQGAQVSGAYDGRLIGMTIDDLQHIPQRICVAGGPEKIAVLRGALKAGYVTDFVTDEATAAALLRPH